MGVVVKCNHCRSSMMQTYSTIIIGLLLIVPLVFASENEPSERKEKLISTFQIVRFPNDVCVSSTTRNGTCYTSAECSDKGGTSGGSCADGFGVCCTFVITTCGQSSSENITYWTQPTSIPTSCGLTICPVTDDICSLRLDFTGFVITGPSSYTLMQVNKRFGMAASQATGTEYLGSSLATNCMTDTFHAQGASPSATPPVVCGTLTGTHMYMDADVDRCNLLSFSFADKVNSALADLNTRGTTAFAARTWDIAVTQIECTSVMLPPPGCTQYFASPSAIYLIESYNWQSGSGIQLGQQHQRICIRRERGKCRGCFAAADALFKIGGNVAIAGNFAAPGGCCGYYTTHSIMAIAGEDVFYAGLGYGDTAGEKAYNQGFDCVIIPGAQGPAEGAIGSMQTTQTATTMAQSITANSVTPMSWPPQICGQGKGLGIGAIDLSEGGAEPFGTAIIAGKGTTIWSSTENMTVCTRNSPFMLEFLTDDLEGQGGEDSTQESRTLSTGALGFQIYSTQLDCA